MSDLLVVRNLIHSFCYILYNERQIKAKCTNYNIFYLCKLDSLIFPLIIDHSRHVSENYNFIIFILKIQ